MRRRRSGCSRDHRPGSSRWRRSDRRGVGPIEVLVVIAVVAIVAMVLMMALTRSREAARSATCARNLQQIGVALELYEQVTRQLPRVMALDEADGEALAPLALMLDQFGTTELSGLDLETPPPTTEPSADPPIERYIPGFVCPSDPIATSRVFPAPVNYRANTGNRTVGRRGPFAPGASVSIAEVEAGHGASYTAAFAERLVGTAGTSTERFRDYQVVPGPIPIDGCPDAPDAPFLDDAGRSWRELGWRSTLYTHAAPPASSRSCISEDGRSAFMGASSGHVEGVRVLLMDGSVKLYSTTVNPAVWAALGSYRDDEEADAPAPPAASSPEPGPEADPAAG